MKTYASVGFTQTELKFIQEVLDDERAWNYKFQYVREHPDFTIFKVPGKDIDKHYADKPHLHGLSVCDRTEKRIYFRKENWDTIPVASGYSMRKLYRTYLILHEFGHMLGHGHAQCTKEGAPAPVMMQQTKGTGMCYPDPWVHHEGKRGPEKFYKEEPVIEIE